MRRWKLYPLLKGQADVLHPRPRCAFCQRTIAAEERQAYVMPSDMSSEEQERIRLVFGITDPERDFLLCTDCVAEHCAGESQHERQPDYYITSDHWMDLLSQAYDAYLKRENSRGGS